MQPLWVDLVGLMEKRAPFVIAVNSFRRDCGGMSEILHLTLEFLLNLVGYVLEAMADIWLGDLTWPQTRTGRILLCAAIIPVGGVIWWKLR